MPVTFTQRQLVAKGISILIAAADRFSAKLEGLERWLELRSKDREINRSKHFFEGLGLAERLIGVTGGALPPHWDDLGTLYRLIIERRPRCVLEYGSGCSTVIIAAALEVLSRSGHFGKLISIESNQHWRDHTTGKLGPDLSSFVDLRFAAPLVQVSWGEVRPRRRQFIWYPGDPRPLRMGVLTLSYPELHEISPDFIYLDGPAPGDAPGYEATDGRSIPAIVTDPLAMEPHLSPGCVMLVDGRQPNSVFLASNFKRNWRASANAGQNNTIFELLPD